MSGTRATHAPWDGEHDLKRQMNVKRSSSSALDIVSSCNLKIRSNECLLQTLDAYILLESPYPEGKLVAAVKQEAQMVAKTGPNSWRPVPLSEVIMI